MLREKTLVAAAHVKMSVKCVSLNCAAEISPPLNFVDWTKNYLGQGENYCFIMALDFLICMQTAFLSNSYENIILKAKQVICLESLYLKKDRSLSCQQDTENLSRVARAKSAFLKFVYSARAVHEREKITQKSGLHESRPRRQFKDCFGIFRFC